MGKVTAEEVMASPLPMEADVELTAGSYQLKESVHGLAWCTMGWPALALEKQQCSVCYCVWFLER